MPQISAHFAGRKPSAIRQAQILFLARADRARLRCVNVSIGNVTLPMHPKMQERMRRLGEPGSPFADGVDGYTPTVGTDEARKTILHVIAAGGYDTTGLDAVMTDGGSQAMELAILGVCGPGSKRPLMLCDPAYTNYIDLAKRGCVSTVSVRRRLDDDGTFRAPDLDALEATIRKENPAGLVIIPADNPTGQFVPQSTLDAIGALAVKYDLWLIGDEAYRQLQYGSAAASSIWGITEAKVPGIRGRRLSIESASKVWNACGLRVGALATDSPELHAKAVAEHTANLCANAIGQWIFAGLLEIPRAELAPWFDQQRRYYRDLMGEVASGFERELPGLIVSKPEAALYSVVDLRRVAPPAFDAAEFVAWCAKEGVVDFDGVPHTLLVAPLGGFYTEKGDFSRTQMRIAFVEPPAEMRKVPKLFAALYRAYVAR